jgi:enoyl-CoA hydratase
MTKSEGFLTEIKDGVLVVRFDRPEIRNPLSVSVITGLSAMFDELPEVRAVIFTGTDASFASGADLREIASVAADAVKEFALRGQTLMSKIAAANVLTIAAVNGFCFGGALDLALACDRRIASPNAAFAHPGAGLGIITGWGGTQRLPRLIGEANALEMFFTAERIDAERALAVGLIEAINPDVVNAAISIALADS